MRNSILVWVFLLGHQLAFSQANYFQKIPFYTIDFVPTELAGYMVVGQGMDFTDRYSIIPTSMSPFKQQSATFRADLKTVNFKDNNPIDQSTVRSVIENISGGYIENVTLDAKVKSIEVNFKASLGIVGSVSASYQFARSEQSNSKTIQVFYELKRSGNPLPDNQINWGNQLTTIESESNDNTKAQKFIDQFGSHYISSVNYGFRIEILADYFSSNVEEQGKFNLAMRAWTAKGNVNFAWQSLLQQSNVRILCKVNSGGLEPNTSAILTGFDEINDFLQKLKNGTIKIYAGPIGYSLLSYKGTLGNFPQTQKIFVSQNDTKFIGDFPKGIILTWTPSPANYSDGDPKNGKLVPPDGWAICDGTLGTPNLQDKFLIGEGKSRNGDFIGNDNNIFRIGPGAINSRVYWFTDPITNNGPLLGPGVGSGWGNYHTLVSKNTDAVDINVTPKSYVVIYLMKL